jgi:hypothetical protein
MWPSTFQRRLDAWAELRHQAQRQPLEQALTQINAWWFGCPWRPYHLHWDDQSSWPDPWELLSDNIYCDVARGLGILYTISLLDRQDLTDTRLVLTDQGHNLVLACQPKYILNWELDTIVNTNHKLEINRHLAQCQVQQKYN